MSLPRRRRRGARGPGSPLVAAALVVLGASGVAVAAEEPDGEALYGQHCAACHQPTGEGLEPTFPSLVGSDLLLGEPVWPIDVVLHGRGAMPPFGGVLSDEEIAAVLTHERTSWGNEAEPIDAAQVADVRASPPSEEPEEPTEEETGAEAETEPAPEGAEAAETEEPAADEPAPADATEAAEADAEPIEVDLPDDWFELGREAFLETCAACHQPDGEGVPGAFPALAGNPFVVGHPQAVLNVVLNGRAGMPSFAGLPDERLALIVSYVRNAWENEAHPVDAEMVATVREGDELDFEGVDPMERPGAGQ